MENISNKSIDRFEEVMSSMKVQCKCGTKTVMTPKTDRCICRGCKNYVYRTKEIEFKYKIKEKMNKL